MLAENIKAIRKNKGYTQEELAAKLNVTRQTVSKWEKGYSVPDADVLEKMAEILEVDIEDLLGKGTPEQKTDPNKDIADQLARLNEQLAVKDRRVKRIWKAVGIAAAVIVVAYILFLVFFLIPDQKEQHTVAGSTSWQCEIDGNIYEYMADYNGNFQILHSGGDEYISAHADLDRYDDANQLSAHLNDYVKEHGGKCNVTEQEGLTLSE